MYRDSGDGEASNSGFRAAQDEPFEMPGGGGGGDPGGSIIPPVAAGDAVVITACGPEGSTTVSPGAEVPFEVTLENTNGPAAPPISYNFNFDVRHPAPPGEALGERRFFSRIRQDAIIRSGTRQVITFDAPMPNEPGQFVVLVNVEQAEYAV